MMFNVFGREAVSPRRSNLLLSGGGFEFDQGSTRRSVQAVGITYVRRSSIGGLERRRFDRQLAGLRNGIRWALDPDNVWAVNGPADYAVRIVCHDSEQQKKQAAQKAEELALMRDVSKAAPEIAVR